MARVFTEKQKYVSKGDMEIVSSKSGIRLSIDKNVTDTMFGKSEYMQVGRDDEEPDKLFFIPSDRKKGYKINREASAYRSSVYLCGERFNFVKDFAGSFDVQKVPGENLSYIQKKNGLMMMDKSLGKMVPRT